jgi:hypothetical protein
VEEWEQWEERRVVVGKVRLKLFRYNYLASKVDGSFAMQEFLWQVN